jgi:hypothetical protein
MAHIDAPAQAKAKRGAHRLVLQVITVYEIRAVQRIPARFAFWARGRVCFLDFLIAFLRHATCVLS